MRRATSLKAPRGSQTAQPYFLPPPVGGLNTRDPPALVPVTEAPLLDSCFPTTTGVMVRKGYTAHTTGITPNECESLMVYTANNGDESMFAAINTDFYDVSTAGALGAAVVSGLTNARWEYVNFTNSSGTAYLCCFNGVDSPRYWNGSAWTTITGVSTPAITGLTTSTIASAAVHQRRLWLVQVNSLKAWYLPIDSVGGAAHALDLGGIATKGGYIMAIAVWTVDGGAGLDDLWVCITSEGQLIAFAGTDPSSASTWQHVGTWNIADPIGRRCLYQYKGDVLIITTAGVASAARLMSGDTGSTLMITDKISGSYRAAVDLIASVGTFGWQLLYFPGADMLILSPRGTNFFPMNTATGAWGGRTALFANCLALFRGEVYFASDTGDFTIRKFWSGTTDGGSSFYGNILSGYSDFGLPAVIKKPSLVRYVMSCPQVSVTVGAGVNADYTLSTSFTTKETTFSTGVLDMTPWLPLSADGVAFSVVFSATSASESPIYNGAFIIFETGGIFGSSSRT